MGSLTAHMRETGDHGRLRFHPSCPVCRAERLSGALSSEPVVPRRAQALLAGGVLMISSSAPGVAAAQEPDRQLEGIAAPEERGAAEVDDFAFDPGGDTALSFDTAPALTAPEDDVDSGSGAPLDVEPTVDLDAQLAPLAETDAPAAEDQAGVPPAESVASGELLAPGPAPPSGALPAGESVPPATPTAPTHTGELAARSGSHGTSSHRIGGSTRSRYSRDDARSGARAPTRSERGSDGTEAPSEATVPISAGAVPAPEPLTIVDPGDRLANGTRQPLDRSARFYAVQPGDSLWSIAKQLLGRDATTVRIAREVNRLWTLNRARIATGDPDLLPVGTRLELR
jgi:nucleoid-associated protein YgaU